LNLCQTACIPTPRLLPLSFLLDDIMGEVRVFLFASISKMQGCM
jgi:hypothetical protein